MQTRVKSTPTQAVSELRVQERLKLVKVSILVKFQQAKQAQKILAGILEDSCIYLGVVGLVWVAHSGVPQWKWGGMNKH